MQLDSHPLSQEMLMAYLDGELSTSEATIAASHLQHCRECQEFAADLQSVSRHLSTWQIDKPNFKLTERLQTAINTHRAKQKKRFVWSQFFGRSRWSLNVVGLSVIFILIAFAIFSRHPAAPNRIESSVYLPEYKARHGFASENSSSGVVGGSLATAPAPNAVPPPPAQDAVSSGPLIIRTAELILTTGDFPHTRENMDRILTSHAGYVAQLEMNTPTDEARSLNANLRIPASQLDTTLLDLKRLGHVDSESQRGEEVTQRVVDVQARLANLRTTETRLTDILRQRTGKLADVLAVEEQIDSVRGQIESIEAEQKNLTRQVAFAAVQLRVKEEYKKPLTLNNSSLLTRLRNAAVEGFQTLGNGVVGLLLFLLSYGPTLLIIAAVLFYPVRRIWKRHSLT